MVTGIAGAASVNGGSTISCIIRAAPK